MDGLTLLIIVGVVVSALGTLGIITEKSREAWSRAADDLGMTLASPHEIRGSRSGLPVKVSGSGDEVGVKIDLRGKIPEHLFLDTEHFSLEPDVVIGDPAFDDRVRVFGPEPYLLATLDATNRGKLLREVVRFGTTVADGRMRRLCGQLGKAVEAVPELVEIAGHLVVSGQEIPDRLARNALTDPVAGVRMRNLRKLIEEYRQAETVVTACRQVLLDDTARSELRFEAACYLQDEGLDQLCELALQDQVDAGLRVRAIEHLVRGRWYERSAPVLEALLAQPSLPPDVLVATIAALGRLGHAAALPRMLEIARDADPRVTVEIARALGLIGDPASEPGLIELLATGDTRTRIAVARALRRIGTAAAVEPLLAISRRFASRALKQEARAAIATIQERLTGAEAGQLSVSVVTDLDGALSPGQSPTGALSFDTSSSPPDLDG
jgi:hypothetical protein